MQSKKLVYLYLHVAEDYSRVLKNIFSIWKVVEFILVKTVGTLNVGHVDIAGSIPVHFTSPN